MKYLGISGGKIVEGFSILPSINLNWAVSYSRKENKYHKIYDVQFSWLFWYFTIGQVKNWLKENGYY